MLCRLVVEIYHPGVRFIDDEQAVNLVFGVMRFFQATVPCVSSVDNFWLRRKAARHDLRALEVSLDLGHGFRGARGGQSRGGEKHEQTECAHIAGECSTCALLRARGAEWSD